MGLNRSSYYLSPATESEENPRLMRLIDQQFLRTPFNGSRRMTASLERSGRFGQSQAGPAAHGIDGPGRDLPQAADHCGGARLTGLPLLLRDRVLTHVNEVWRSDITYVPMRHGFMYLTAVIDWFSRYVLSWRLPNTLEGQFCLEAHDEALSMGRPDLQHRPGFAFHGEGLHQPLGGGRDRGEPGRSGAFVGQRVRGATVEEREIRKHIH